MLTLATARRMLATVNLTVGNGGWVRVDDPERLPGPLYVRMNRDDVGRWRITQLYLDGERPITGEEVRRLPIAQLEAWVTDPDVAEVLERRAKNYGVQLDVLASHFDVNSYGSQARHWVSDAWRSQFPNSGMPVAKLRQPKRPKVSEPPPLRAPEGGRLTDDFLREVHRAYTAAVTRGEWPAPTLAEQAGVSVHAVRKWIYTARKRKIMPPGRQGVVS